MQQRESESQNIKENIDNILQKVSGDRADIAYIIYEQIVKCPGAEPEILKYFYEYSGDVHREKEELAEEVYTAADKYQLSAAYGKMIDGALEALLRRNLPCHEFYAELWDFIENGTILSEKKESFLARQYPVIMIWNTERLLLRFIRMQSSRVRRSS